ncbi:MAG: 30S ribosome-binding factor RbfA [Fimbriimonadales bacterium]|nr:30S ribosome-binding factor RbfA [Fimbriimonadales bacterium]MCS7190447.1 30S ribosome-binding factor RbfA [Fimbriimonadales bacterium]
MGGRMERLESLLTAELSQVLLKDLSGQDLGLATITGVKIARDLSQATVYVSVLGDERRRKQTLESLQRSAGYIKGLLGKRLHLKRIPKLIFVDDPSLRDADRINRLLKDG